jgi:hypothetical protein
MDIRIVFEKTVEKGIPYILPRIFIKFPFDKNEWAWVGRSTQTLRGQS